MNAVNLHPLFREDRQFDRDFEGILQIQAENIALSADFVEAKLAKFKQGDYLAFLNSKQHAEYSKLPKGVSFQDNILNITQDLITPLILVFFDDARDTCTLNINLRKGVYAELLTVFYSTASAVPYHHISLNCEKDSSLFYHYLQSMDPSASHFSEIHLKQAQNSNVFNSIGLISGLRSAILLNTQNTAEHTQTKSEIVTLLKNRSVAHFVSHSEHSQKNCTSSVNAKSLLSDKSRLHFLGKIDVNQTAFNIDAYLRHQTLLLSETAEVTTQPQLEINNKNIKCAHGATVGQLDKEALFYLKSRGIIEKDAKAILMQAFCESIVLQAKSTFWQTEMLNALRDLGAA